MPARGRLATDGSDRRLTCTADAPSLWGWPGGSMERHENADRPRTTSRPGSEPTTVLRHPSGPTSYTAPTEPAPSGESGAPRVEAEGASGDGHNPSLNKLGKTLRKGAAISAVVLVATQCMALTQAIVTARLLSPVEVGVFFLGTMFSNYLVTMAGGGMKAALIQRDSEVEDAANTAFWASVGTGLAMATIALCSAPLLGWFFEDPQVGLVAAVTCGTLFIHALLNVPEALMQRGFNFKRKLIVDPLTSGTFTVVSISLVATGYGIWGLVIALYASQVATLIASWTLARWRPGRGKPRYRLWREMASFSFPLIIQGIAANLRDSAQPAIVGKFLDVATAGQYRNGRRIGTLPGQAIIQVVSYVLFPAFSRIAGDAVRFRRGFLRSLRLLWTVTLPMGVLLAAVGSSAIVVLLGADWAPAGVFVAAMAGFGPGTAMNAVGVESIKGAGRSRLIHWVTATSIVVGVGGLVALLPLGLLGVGLAASLEGLVAGTLTLALARRVVGVTWGEMGRVMMPPVGAALVAGAATAVLEHGVFQSATRSVVSGLALLLVDAVVFAGLYLVVLSVLAPATVGELRALLAKLRSRPHHTGEDDASGSDTRLGEDYLLDAPTIILGLREDPATERLVAPLGPQTTPQPRGAQGHVGPTPAAAPHAAQAGHQTPRATDNARASVPPQKPRPPSASSHLVPLVATRRGVSSDTTSTGE